MSTISADATQFQDGPDSVTTLSQARRSRGLWADALRQAAAFTPGHHFWRAADPAYRWLRSSPH